MKRRFDRNVKIGLGREASLRLAGLATALMVLAACSGPERFQISDEERARVRSEVGAAVGTAARSGRKEVAAAYEDYLHRYGDGDPVLRQAALVRLGDLHLELGQGRFLEQMRRYDEHPVGPPPVVDYSKAISYYETLLRENPGHSAAGHTLYSLARAHAEMGDTEKSFGYLSRLEAEHPESPNRHEIQFRLGEFHFDRGDYAKASSAYRQSLLREDPELKDKARYKLGWSEFKRDRHREAVEGFLPLIEDEKNSLYWEAMAYVALSFRQLGGPDAVSDYLGEKNKRRFEKDLYLMLGNQYFAEGDIDRAIPTYRGFVKRNPTHPMAPFLASHAADLIRRKNDMVAYSEAMAEWVGAYGSRGSWRRANTEEARGRTRPILKEYLQRLGNDAYARGREKGDPVSYRTAIGWYEEFLTEFRGEKESTEIRFMIADAWYRIPDYSEAGRAYEATARKEKDKDLGRKAAYAGLLAFEKIETPAGREQFLALAAFYTEAFPTTAEAPEVFMKAGELLYNQKRYAEARRFFIGMLSQYPKHEKSRTLSKLIGHTYMNEERYEEALGYYSRIVSSAQGPEKKEITDLMAAALYKQGDRLRREGRPREAAVLFQRIVAEAPESDLAAGSLMEAGELLEAAGDSEGAVLAYRKVIDRYGPADFAAQAWLRTGLIHERKGRRLKMAEAYERASAMMKEPDQAAQLLWTAAAEYEHSSRWEESYNAYEGFGRRFPQHPDRAESLHKLAVIRDKQGNRAEALRLYERLEKEAPGTYQAAQGSFYRAEAVFEMFKAVRLEEPLDQSLERKLSRLDETVSLYVHSAESGYFDLVTASAHRLGEVFEHFRDALLSSEPPKELTAEQREEYVFLLEERAFPFEEKAVEAYESNIVRMRNSGDAYGEWIRKSYARLAELRPTVYRRPERAEHVINVLDLESLEAREDRIVTLKNGGER